METRTRPRLIEGIMPPRPGMSSNRAPSISSFPVVSQKADSSPKSVVASRVQNIESHLSQKKTMLTKLSARRGLVTDTAAHRSSNLTVYSNVDIKDDRTLVTTPSDEASVSVDAASIDSAQGLGAANNQATPPTSPENTQESLRQRVIFFDLGLDFESDLEPLKETVSSLVKFGTKEVSTPSSEVQKVEEPHTPTMSEVTPRPDTAESEKSVAPQGLSKETSPTSVQTALSNEGDTRDTTSLDSLRRRVVFFDLDPDNIPDIDRLHVFNWATSSNESANITPDIDRLPLFNWGTSFNKAATQPPNLLCGLSEIKDYDQSRKDDDASFQTTHSSRATENIDNASVASKDSETSLSKEEDVESTLYYGSTGKPEYSFFNCPGASTEHISPDEVQHDQSIATCGEQMGATENNTQGTSSLHDILTSIRSDKASWMEKACDKHHLLAYHNNNDDSSEDDEDESSFDSESEQDGISSVQPESRLTGILEAIRSTATPKSTDSSVDTEDPSTKGKEYNLDDRIGSHPTPLNRRKVTDDRMGVSILVDEKKLNADRDRVDDHQRSSFGFTPYKLSGSVFYNGVAVSSTIQYPDGKDTCNSDSKDDVDLTATPAVINKSFMASCEQETGTKTKKMISRYDDDYNPSDLESMSDDSSFNRKHVSTLLVTQKESTEECISKESITWIVPSEIIVDSHFLREERIADDTLTSPAMNTISGDAKNIRVPEEASLFRKTMAKSLKLKGASPSSKGKVVTCPTDRNTKVDETITPSPLCNDTPSDGIKVSASPIVLQYESSCVEAQEKEDKDNQQSHGDSMPRDVTLTNAEENNSAVPPVAISDEAQCNVRQAISKFSHRKGGALLNSKIVKKRVVDETPAFTSSPLSAPITVKSVPTEEAVSPAGDVGITNVPEEKNSQATLQSEPLSKDHDVKVESKKKNVRALAAMFERKPKNEQK